MDQPNYDRFICVLKGTQRYEVLKRKEPHHCVQSKQKYGILIQIGNIELLICRMK